MTYYRIRHAGTGEVVATEKTKKAATALAAEATEAHTAIDALHNGLPVSFEIEKIEETVPAVEEAA